MTKDVRKQLREIIDKDIISVPPYIEIRSQMDYTIHEMVVETLYLIHKLNSNKFLTDKDIDGIIRTFDLNLDLVMEMSNEKLVLDIVGDVIIKIDKYSAWSLANENYEFISNAIKFIERGK